MSLFLYKLYISLLGSAISLGSIFSTRARRWHTDRDSQVIDLPTQPTKAWFHVSSLGELEQAYPLIEAIKRHNYYIVVSFFSHSGYDQLSKYPLIDRGLLLPLDKPSNAKKIVQDIDAQLVFWTKNDFWLNTMNAIMQRGTPLILFAAAFYKGHFLHKYGFGIFRKTFSQLEHIFVQDENSLRFLHKCNISNVSIGGDTRVIRVKQRALTPKSTIGLDEYIGNKPVLILASVHTSDKHIITRAISTLKDQYKIIVVPHHIDLETIDKIMKDIPEDLYQVSTHFEDIHADIIVLRKIGVLFDLYRHADIVYIGGGFGRGIHNILEPTVFGKSVIFGPNYSKFWEANLFLKQGLSINCTTDREFIEIANQLNIEKRNSIKNALFSFYKTYPESVEKIINYCITQKLIH